MLSRYCPHIPTDRQALFLWLDQREAFYGGAAGGGKSDALLMASLLFVDVPDYAALLLRRTYADLALPGAIMDRAGEWLRSTDAHWVDDTKTWHFPSGATLTFGYLQTETDKYRYQGAEFQFIGYDELPQFTQTQYTYLLSRIRRATRAQVPLRMRGAGNPGGIGHEWVKARFIAPRSPDRPFIPALLTDNPHLDQAGYRRSLASMDEVTRAQLEDGNWDVLPSGQYFRKEWFPILEVAPAGSAARVRYWDLAATPDGGDWTVGLRMARTVGGSYLVEDVVRGRWAPGDRDAAIRATAQQDGRSVAVVIEQEPGSAGLSVIHSLVTMLAGHDVSGERSTGPKTTRAMPLASQAKVGNVALLRGTWNGAWLDEMAAFADGLHDDQVDAASGAFNKLASVETVAHHAAAGGERAAIHMPTIRAARPTRPNGIIAPPTRS